MPNTVESQRNNRNLRNRYQDIAVIQVGQRDQHRGSQCEKNRGPAGDWTGEFLGKPRRITPNEIVIAGVLIYIVNSENDREQQAKVN
jgi:hypothetical protein